MLLLADSCQVGLFCFIIFLPRVNHGLSLVKRKRWFFLLKSLRVFVNHDQLQLVRIEIVGIHCARGHLSYFGKAISFIVQGNAIVKAWFKCVVECIQLIVDCGLIYFIIQADNFLIWVMYSSGERENSMNLFMITYFAQVEWETCFRDGWLVWGLGR